MSRRRSPSDWASWAELIVTVGHCSVQVTFGSCIRLGRSICWYLTVNETPRQLNVFHHKRLS